MSDALSVHRVAAGAMAQRAAAVIGDWLDDGAEPADVAVLARVNSALLPIQVVLGEQGVAHTAPLDRTVLRRTGIRAALAYLRIGLDPERIERSDIIETVNRPSRQLKSTVSPLLKRSQRWSLGRLEDAAGMLDGSRATRFEGYLDDLRTLTDAITAGADTEEALALIRGRIGLGEAMDALDSSTTRPQGSGHGDDLDALEQLASLQPDPVAFEGWLAEQLTDPGADDGVTLSTVHRVKGMEWDRVVVFAANAGLMPHRLADDVEEERRVFHVALTRCRESVAVVAARDAASPFIGEMRRAAEGPPPTRRGSDDLPDGVEPRRTGGDRVAADPGLAVTLPGGVHGRVVEAGEEAATVALEVAAGRPDALVTVAYGDRVGVAGGTAQLGPPPRSRRVAPASGGRGTGDDDRPLGPDGQDLMERLRGWRSRTARAQDVPAYVVLHDAHLRAIAERRPSTERELARCPGIGPTRLERYGDDLLAIVAGGE